jgi:hypothetical protein
LGKRKLLKVQGSTLRDGTTLQHDAIPFLLGRGGSAATSIGNVVTMGSRGRVPAGELWLKLNNLGKVISQQKGGTFIEKVASYLKLSRNLAPNSLPRGGATTRGIGGSTSANIPFKSARKERIDAAINALKEISELLGG